MAKRRGLTPKQQRFVAEYLVDLNATQAAIRAGYRAASAYSIGSENLRKPEVAAAVAAGNAKHLAAKELTAASVIEAIRRQVQGDVRCLFDKGGNYRPIQELTAEEASLIGGLEVVIKNAEAGDGHTDKVLKLKLKDQSRYVEMGAKRFGLLTDNVKVTGDFDPATILRGRFAK